MVANHGQTLSPAYSNTPALPLLAPLPHPPSPGTVIQEEMAKLAASMATKKREFRFPDLIDLCHELGLFIRLIGDGEDREPLARRERTIFSRILSKFDGRI